MNKSELIDIVAANQDIPKTRAAALVNSVFDVMSDTLVNGEKVVITDFGTFAISHRKEFKGHNPRTGDQVTVPSRRVPRFKAGKSLRERMNS